ncbi:hypothetical protein KUV85_09045 [Nocardioides panacisoli]|uniref:phospholipase D-like domain-containing protein n=1 Tax=Nocardioides panacisoli TaxID=627624 RepID=UPI001C638F4F|nr:phospholipase D-like domain-containing protein [Nocardioides panacisoli]QYJ02486.1 hypothetical protein KUV85_09045 [Nocardioides panacisoli]
MHMKKIVVATLLTVGLVVSTLGVSGTSAASPAPVSGVTSVGASNAASAGWANWGIGKGQTFNDPRNSKKWKIIDKIKRTIKHTPGGQKIWVMTWNLQSKGIVKQLIRAHNRGVSVRLIMSRQLAKEQNGNGSFWTLTRGLKKGNAKRGWARKSFTRTCSNSCRGWGGSMHSKFMMVSKAGKRSKIVSQGSANFTHAAATRQWNDWYTVYEKGRVWRAYKQVFKQSLKDKRFGAVQAWQDQHNAWFAPFGNQGDKVMQLLNKVQCGGAVRSGVDGRTALRIASSVFQNKRGLRIARKIKQLHNQGCNIRVVFTMMTNKIRNALSGVPTRHLVYDWDSDGSFDRYLHMKVMTISGNWNGDRDHRLVFNGSANWSKIGAISDEQGMVVHLKWPEKQYAKHINYLFNTAPLIARGTPDDYKSRGTNPYAGLELELAGQG